MKYSKENWAKLMCKFTTVKAEHIYGKTNRKADHIYGKTNKVAKT